MMGLTLMVIVGLFVTTAMGCEDSAKFAASCPGWAAIGECDKNPAHMKVNCAKSCNTCELAAGGLLLSRVAVVLLLNLLRVFCILRVSLRYLLWEERSIVVIVELMGVVRVVRHGLMYKVLVVTRWCQTGRLTSRWLLLRHFRSLIVIRLSGLLLLVA